MELLDLSKVLRREVKKAGMELEKTIKPINTALRTERGAVTGGVKEKRAVNEAGLNKLVSEVVATSNYTASDVVVVEKDLLTVTLTANAGVFKSKNVIVFNVSMTKGKIALTNIAFLDTASDSVALEVTLKDVKESLKSVKAE